MKSKYCIAGVAALCLCSCGGGKDAGSAGFSGEDMTRIATIHRNKQTKTATIEVREDMAWKLYGGLSVGAIDLSKPLCDMRADGIFPLDVPDSVRSYFQIVTPRGNAILAERHLPMTGGYNFRDLGGYRTVDGRYVKWGVFIRGDEMAHLTDADMRYLESIPVVSVIDFRTDREAEATPDRFPATTTGRYRLPVNPGNVIGVPEKEMKTEQQAADLMKHMYRQMVAEAEVVESYRKFFALLQDEGNLPVIYHCTAGKDRTGMATALILSALGVDEETILADYELSNHYLGDKYAPYIEEFPASRPLMVIHPDYLKAGFAKIRELYGSVESYLTVQLGVDIEAFRAKYLY